MFKVDFKFTFSGKFGQSDSVKCLSEDSCLQINIFTYTVEFGFSNNNKSNVVLFL
jgi:hypothetical protein